MKKEIEGERKRGDHKLESDKNRVRGQGLKCFPIITTGIDILKLNNNGLHQALKTDGKDVYK